MQALLSYDQSPPLYAPMRFFLTAPCFGMLAGLLVLWSGWSGSDVELNASRWTPVVLALTHLVTVGIMLQVMLGAVIQIMPVLAGANMVKPMRLARVVHALISLGALTLTAAFLSSSPLLFKLAALLLGLGIAYFVGSAVYALYGIPSSSPSIRGLKIAILGLSVTVGLGATLAITLGGSLGLPSSTLADIHLGWGFVAWGTILLAAVAYVVVPMFQLTPAYPDWFGRWYSVSLLVVVLLWTIAEYCSWNLVSLVLGVGVVSGSALFAGITLKIQRHTKRAHFDATQHYWRGAMLSALAACGLWLAARTVPLLADWPVWPLVFGVLVLFGGFVSVIFGMLYKIVPFLIWLHLQQQGQGRVMAPNMKRVIAERAMNGQLLAHFASCLLLLLALMWPNEFDYPAGLALVAANAWLLRNLLAGLSVYRGHLRKIESVFSGAIRR